MTMPAITITPVPPWKGEAELALMISMLRELPSEVVGSAHAIVQAGVPVYTGTYREAIENVEMPGLAVLGVSEEGLMASAATHREDPAYAMKYPHQSPEQYVHGNPVFKKKKKTFTMDLQGIGPPYPLRIETDGSPVHSEGEGMWHEAAAAATARFAEYIVTAEVLL